MTDEELRTLWGSMNGNPERIAKAKEVGLGNTFERNRDEYNDIINYAPTAEQQTYDLGTDDAGNPILGNTLNDAFMQSAPQKKQDKSALGNLMEYMGSNVPERVDDYDDGDDVNRDDNMDMLVGGEKPFLERTAGNLYDAAKNSKLYSAFVYTYGKKGDEWLERCRLIQEKTGIDVTGVSDSETFQKMWQAYLEIEQKEKLATDENGHTNMDKLREMVPYLADLEEARDVAGAMMILNAAPGFKSISDVYDSELGKIGGSFGVGLERTKLMLQKQLIGAPAWLRGLINNEGFTPEEARDILLNAQAEGNLPQYSYNSVGGAIGGIVGNTAEQFAIQAPGWIAPKNTYGMIAAGLIMTAQIGSQDYIDLLSETDKNGNPKYTPRQAALIAAMQAPVETALELAQVSTIKRWITGSGTAKKLLDIYKADAALTSGTRKELVANMARELVDGGIKSGVIAGGTEVAEEFSQSISNNVIENAADVLIHGKDADVKTAEEILTDAVKEAAEAVPSVVGFTAFGGAAHGVSTYRRFRVATSSRLARDVMENAQDSAIIDGVGERLDEIEEIKDKNLRESALDSINEKHGMREREVDIKTLAALNQQEIVDQVVKASGTSEEEVQKCMEGTGFLTVKTSVLQQLSHDMTPEQREVLSQHRTAKGRETTYQATEYAKNIREALKAVDMKKVKDEAAAVDNFVNSEFEDEGDRNEALDIVAANMANPALETRRRQKETREEIKAILAPTIAALKEGAGQGTDIIQQEERGGRGIRVSNNAQWYQNFYADHGRPPTEAEYEQIAYENLVGTATRYALDSMMVPGVDMQELQEYYANAKAEMDSLYERQERLTRIGEVFSGFNSGEFMAQASMPEGAREAYQVIYDALKASGVKSVSSNARVNAILAARIAERAAQEHRAAGQTDVKAVDILPRIVGGLFTEEDAEALNQFAGENAETADKVKLAEAQQMEADGKAPDEIYKATGWFKGLDGKWRFEIADDLDKIDFSRIKNGKIPGLAFRLSDIYNNPELFKAYPWLKQVYVVAHPMRPNKLGSYDRKYKNIQLNKGILQSDSEQLKKTLIHEIQHAIQFREGFAIGGNAEQSGSYDNYRRLGGEQEAREAARRAGLQKDLEQVEQEIKDAKGDKDKLKKAQFKKTMIERQLGDMPSPHKSDAIIVFDGKEMPYNVSDEEQDGKPNPDKKDESLAGKPFKIEEYTQQGIEARNTSIFNSVLNGFIEQVDKLAEEGIADEQINKLLDAENSNIREQVILPWRRLYNQFHAKGADKKELLDRVTKRKRTDEIENLEPSELTRAFNIMKERIERMVDDADVVYKELVFRRRSGQDVAGVHTWRELEQSIAAHGGTTGFSITRAEELNNEQANENRLNQGGFSNAKRVTRGQYSPKQNIVSLFQDADQSTFMHEMSHFYLVELEQLAKINPDGQAAKDFAAVFKWAEWHEGDAEEFKGTASAKYFAELEKKIIEAEKAGDKDKADDLKWTWQQEKFARGFEDYLRKGNAPTSALQKIFRSFKGWLTRIYKDFVGAGVKPSAEVEAVMARMVATDEEIEMHSVMKQAESVARINPDLLDKETSAMYERWEKEAKEEAKEKLLAELIKEQETKDIAAHMEEFEEAERERLANDPAFAVAEALKDESLNLTEEEAAQIGDYNSVEAWKKDLQEKGGSYEAALSASMEAERKRYTEEMPNQARISEMAEEALVSSDYEQRLSAMEAEILNRRKRKYANAPKRLADAFREAEEALELEEADDPIKAALLKLKYAHRWEEKQAKQIEKMQETIEQLKSAAQEEKDKMRKKLNEQIQQMKDATLQNADWLRGVRDATKGVTKEIRQMAIQQLNGMSVKDATNVRHWINEAKKAGQESAKHLVNAARKNNGKDKEDGGDRSYELARQAKLRQTYYTVMAAESLKYRRELQKIQNDMKRVQKGLVNAKGEIDASTRYYLGHIQYMLGFRGKDAIVPQSLESFAALFNSMKNRYDDNTGATESIGDIDSDIEIPQWLMELAISQKRMPTKYADYTIEELQDMRKVVDMLYKTARNKNALLSENFDGKQVADIEAELREDFQKTVTVESGEEGLSEFFAELLKPVVMLKALGTKWKKYIYDPLFDAFENQERMSMQAAEELNKLFNDYWTKKERRKMRNDELAVTLPDGTKLTKEQVLAMALNWGNEGNRLRLRNSLWPDRALYSDVDIENIFKQVLTAKDWEFVQKAWDYINTFGDKVNAVVEKLTGVPMTRVEPMEFIVNTSDGKTVHLRGGYYPIVYDPTKSSVTAEQELTTSQKAFGGAVFSTGMGSTKNRAQAGPMDAKLLLSMDVLFRHVNQQIHIATMRLACRDVYKLLQDRGIRSMVESSIGMNAYRELKRWVENVWQEPVERMSGAERFLEAGRKNTVAAIMAYRASVALLNFANPTLMARELGAWNSVLAVIDYIRNGNRQWILEDSPFLRNRANNIDRDIKRAQKNSFTPDNPFQDMVARTSGWLMEQTDMLFSLPTYNWVYKQTLNDALEKGMTQEAAAREAHHAAGETVRKIFGSADTVDQSYYQRSNKLIIKAITPFYTYVSTQANAVWEEYLKARYQGSNVTVADNGAIQKQKKAFMKRWGAMAHAVLFTYIIETLVEQLMRDAISYITGDDDDKLLDEKEFAKRWAAQGLTTFTSAIPVVNMAGELVGNFIMGKNYNLRGFGVVSAAQERVAKVGGDIGKLAQGKGDAIEISRDIAKAAGAFTAFPDVFTDAIFNAARAYKENYSFNEWFINSLFDKKLKAKNKRR